MPATYRKEGSVYRMKLGKPMAKPGRRCRRDACETNLVSLLHQGATYGDAARSCGISRPTFQRWMQDDAIFRYRMWLAKHVGKHRKVRRARR